MRLSVMRLFLAFAVLCLASGAADGSETARRKSLWGRISSPVAGLYRRGRNAVVRASKFIAWRGGSSPKKIEITDDSPPLEGDNEVVREELPGEEGEEEKGVVDMAVDTDAKPGIESISKMDDSVDDAMDPVETEGSDPKEGDAGGETDETGETAAFAQTEGSDLKELEVAGETATSTETEGSRQEAIAEKVTDFAASSQPKEGEISETAGEVAETSEVLGETQDYVPGTTEVQVSLPDEAVEGAVESEVKEAAAEVAEDGANEKTVEEKANPRVSEL